MPSPALNDGTALYINFPQMIEVRILQLYRIAPRCLLKCKIAMLPNEMVENDLSRFLLPVGLMDHAPMG